MCGEWTYEGGEKAMWRVIPDGSRGRYPGGAHDGACRVGVFANVGGTAGFVIDILSHGVSMGQDFFICIVQ